MGHSNTCCQTIPKSLDLDVEIASIGEEIFNLFLKYFFSVYKIRPISKVPPSSNPNLMH
ncbi:hypothetical protein QTP88_028866 [Uroleucon formosanum]